MTAICKKSLKYTFCFLAVVPALLICFFSCVSSPQEPVSEQSQIQETSTVADESDTVVSDEPEVVLQQKAESTEIAQSDMAQPATEETPIQAEPAFTPFKFAENLNALLETGTISDALELFDSVPVEYKDDFDLNFLQASLLFSVGKIDEASVLEDRLLQQEPENIDVLMLGTVIAKSKGDDVAKKALLKKILTCDPNNADANVELAEEQMLRKNYSQARRYYKQALDSDAEHESALFGYGQVSYYIGQYKESKNAFNKLLKIDSKNGFAYAYLAKLATEDENYKVATDYMEKALEYEPDYYDFWIEYGSCLRYSGRYNEAESAWTKAISLNPDYFLGYVYRSGLYDETSEFDKALDDYRKIVALNPKYYYAYESLGMLEWYKENWEGCRNAFIKAQEVNPDSASYTLMISATYLKQNKTKENKDFLTKAMKKLDKSTLDYSMVRLYYEQNGDSAVVQKVLEEKNRNTKGKMLFYLALYYDLRGNDSLAKKYYIEVQTLQSPMFFEYRLNDWALEES